MFRSTVMQDGHKLCGLIKRVLSSGLCGPLAD